MFVAILISSHTPAKGVATSRIGILRGSSYIFDIYPDTVTVSPVLLQRSIDVLIMTHQIGNCVNGGESDTLEPVPLDSKA